MVSFSYDGCYLEVRGIFPCHCIEGTFTTQHGSQYSCSTAANRLLNPSSYPASFSKNNSHDNSKFAHQITRELKVQLGSTAVLQGQTSVSIALREGS